MAPKIGTIGVVVEKAGENAFIGMGTVRFGTVQDITAKFCRLLFWMGSRFIRIFAAMVSDIKSPAGGYRKQRRNWGISVSSAPACSMTIMLPMQLPVNGAGNLSNWACQVLFVPTVARKPKPPAGTGFHEIEPKEYQEFAGKQNKFYRQYNSYPPTSPETIVHALSVNVEGKRPYRYFAAVDTNGHLLAGVQTWARGLLKCDKVNHLPTVIRVINKLAHLLPPDFTIRDVAANGFWYEAGQERAARYLWKVLRWACRDQGTTLTAVFDIRDPAVKLLPLKPWHQPRFQITYAIRAPTSLNRDQLLFASGRI